MSVLDKSLISTVVDLSPLTRVMYTIHVPERVLTLYESAKRNRKPSFVTTGIPSLDQNLYSREVKLKFTIEVISEIIAIEPSVRFDKLDDIIAICLAIYQVLHTLPNANKAIKTPMKDSEKKALRRIAELYELMFSMHRERMAERLKEHYTTMGDDQTNPVIAKQCYNVVKRICAEDLIILGELEIEFILDEF